MKDSKERKRSEEILGNSTFYVILGIRAIR